MIFIVSRVRDNVELAAMASRDDAEELARIITSEHGWSTCVFPRESSAHLDRMVELFTEDCRHG